MNIDGYYQRWLAADLWGLPKAFHTYDKNSGTYKRFAAYSIERSTLQKLLDKGKFEKIKILLGLHEPGPGKAIGKFLPVLNVVYKDGSNASALFKVAKLPHRNIDSKIPKPFADALIKNWQTQPFSALENIFTTRTKDSLTKENYLASPDGTSLQRVNRYIFFKEINGHIFKALKGKKYDQIVFHLGLDLNKAGTPGEYVFSPFIELTSKNKYMDEDIAAYHLLGARIIRADTSDSMLYEYISPCPPTCCDSV